ncbi:MAG: oligosaccharide flippase family protein [bacterium]|nr:oligosaccharide flippase family protein [Candidatus Sumerlaeota bacterium]
MLSNFYYTRLKALSESAYTTLFGLVPTSGVKQFFKHLGIITISFALARVISAIASIMAARLLGPAQFGDSQLVITVAQFFAIPAIMGMNTTMIRYGAKESNPGPVIASAFWFVVAASVITTVVGFIGASVLEKALSVSSQVYMFGLVCGAAFSLFVILGSALQTLSKFVLRGLSEISFSVLFLLLVMLSFRFLGISFQSASISYTGAYILALVLGVIPIARHLRPSLFDAKTLRMMLHYASYNAVCGIGFFLTFSIQRLLLNHMLSSADVGRYSLYSTASVNFATYAGSMLATVFFPKVAASSNREGLWILTVRSWIWLLIPSLIIVSLFQILVIVLSGKNQYPLDASLIILFSLTSWIIMIQSSLGQIIGAEGVRGARLGLQISLTLGCLNLLLSWLLIPYFHVHGTVIALMCSYALSTLWLVRVRRAYF